MLQKLTQRNRLFFVLLSIDFLILLLHVLFGREQQIFHLDFEQNLPTFYQSLKLLSFGCIFFLLGWSKHVVPNLRAFIIPLSLFMVVLGFDELLQIHENIYRVFEFFDVLHPSKVVEASMRVGYQSSLWILYYIPFIAIFVFWSGYWLKYFQSKSKNIAWIMSVSSLSLFTVLMTEILSSTGSYSQETYFWLITLEETAEMLLASTLVHIGSRVLSK